MKLLLMFFILYLIQEDVAGRGGNQHNPKRHGKIINGNLTDIEKYPFFVNLAKRTMKRLVIEFVDSRFCGGSIISSYWVATAAHCIRVGEEKGVVEWWVMPGVNDYWNEQDTGAKHTVERAFEHESYDNNTDSFDIGLIKVSNKFQFSRYIQRITIAGPNYQYKAGSDCMAAGCGVTEPNSNSSWIRELKMEILDDDSCNRWRYTPDQLCAKHPQNIGKVFRGDSGGPLVQLRGNHVVLIGIVSHGSDSTDGFHLPQIFIRTGFKIVTKWIRRHKTGARFYCKK